MAAEFTPEQKRYLEGFAAGVQIARSQTARRPAQGQPDASTGAAAAAPNAKEAESSGPNIRGVGGPEPNSEFRQKTLRSRKVQERATSVRLL